MNKKRGSILVGMTAALLAIVPTQSFGQAGALLPYTFAGKISDYYGAHYETNSAVEIRVRNLDGGLLAKTSIKTSTESPFNYRLPVPVASAPATGYAVVGEGLVFEIFDGVSTTYTSLVPANQAVIGNPGGICVVDVVLSSDSNSNGIPDQYENYIAYLMSAQGIEGPYDPDADSDGDGFSNRAEFLAGTQPLNAADKFQIISSELAFGLVGEDLFAISFITAGGRTYSVKATADLKTIQDAPIETFKIAPASAEQTYLHTSSLQAEVVTLYLIPKGSMRFYQLVVE